MLGRINNHPLIHNINADRSHKAPISMPPV